MTKIREIKLETERLILRKPSVAEWDFVYNNITKNKDYPRFTTIPMRYTKDMAKTWVKKVRKEFGNESYVFFMTLKETKDPIGNMGFNEIDKNTNTAKIGYITSKEYRRKGYTSEACKALIDFGFKVLKLNRIRIEHVPDNEGSKRIIKKMGFKCIGHERQCIKSGDGKLRDHLSYDMLRNEWNPNKVRLNKKIK